MCEHEISILTEYKDNLSNLICCFLPQANRTCPICRADASEVQRDSEWPHEGARHSLMPVRHVQHCLLSLSLTHIRTHTHSHTTTLYICDHNLICLCSTLFSYFLFILCQNVASPRTCNVIFMGWLPLALFYHANAQKSSSISRCSVCLCVRVRARTRACTTPVQLLLGPFCNAGLCVCVRECEWGFFFFFF